MLPLNTINNKTNPSVRYTKHSSKFSKAIIPAFVQMANFQDLLFGEFRLSISFPSGMVSENLPAMGIVFNTGHVLKVARYIICFVSIFVVDGFLIWWHGANKGGDHQLVYTAYFLVAISPSHGHQFVPISVGSLFKHHFWQSSLVSPTQSVQSFNIANTANLIKPFPSNHVSPFFCHLFTQLETPLAVVQRAIGERARGAMKTIIELSTLNNKSTDSNLNYITGVT